MESFPEKILVAIYVTALAPNTRSPPASLLQEFFNRTSTESLMDFQVSVNNGPEKPKTVVSVGPKYLANNAYQCCQPEDLELAKMMVRPSGMFSEDLAKESLLTEEKFGSVQRAFVVCEKDGSMDEDFQRWLIENSQTKEVEVILGADHMVMLSNPHELRLRLQKIVEKHC
ncbi:Alpha/Beta hydrolase fold containing protein [Trema orientale]|uniref:Alpha/Beta hydrolase fold containing protein n=1 Tax=Trema orientale TaxID=63057 RepID=A0A2P5FY62_TREOI|nr:Alpha/Beta hydrolase fold containing protein [Trema orientale]